MIDILSASLRAVAERTLYAPAFVFAAGVASSCGPCIAPRLIGISSCTSAKPARAPAAASTFLLGLTLAYASFGIVAGMLGRFEALASWTYGALAVALGTGGIVMLIRADSESTLDQHVMGADRKPAPLPLGAVFALGASFAFVMSPCCAPAMVAIMVYTTQTGDPAYGAALLGLYGFGHGLPVALFGFGVGRLAEHLRAFALHQTTTIVGAVLSLVLAGYYACLI